MTLEEFKKDLQTAITYQQQLLAEINVTNGKILYIEEKIRVLEGAPTPLVPANPAVPSTSATTRSKNKKQK